MALNNPGAYTMYPSGYLVVGPHDYTKHYYSGSQRIASRSGDLSAVHNFESDSALKQGIETKKHILQKQLATIYKKANLGKPNFTLAPQAPIDPVISCKWNASLVVSLEPPTDGFPWKKA